MENKKRKKYYWLKEEAEKLWNLNGSMMQVVLLVLEMQPPLTRGVVTAGKCLPRKCIEKLMIEMVKLVSHHVEFEPCS